MTAASDGAAAPSAGWLDARREGDRLIVAFRGSWETANATELDAALGAVNVDGVADATLDLAGLKSLDTAGAWLVHRTRRSFEAAGTRVTVTGAGKARDDLLEAIAEREAQPSPPAARPHPFAALVVRVGAATLGALAEGRDLTAFVGHTLIVAARTARRPGRLRATALIAHLERSGIDAMPIVGLVAFLVGVVLAFQSADQLARFGAEIFTVNIVGQGMLREMGVLLTAIMLAGRSGSAFTAEIGTMVVNEEVDAMRVLGIDPMEALVLPRVLALVVALPLLAFFADLTGLLGGALMAALALDISPVQFVRQLGGAVTSWTFWIGILKAPIFGFTIGLVGCFRGLRVVRSAESVGTMTTRAVVEAIFLVIVFDAMFSILFSVLGI
ncbi:MAG: MlaE family lipid ABC transporter permease subunit [Alphaproteobacteria bacterium]